PYTTLFRSQCGHQIANQSVEISAGDAHTGVCGLHVLARVLAGATRSLADLVDQVHLELLELRRILYIVREERHDLGVGRAAADEVVDDSSNALLAAKALI